MEKRIHLLTVDIGSQETLVVRMSHDLGLERGDASVAVIGCCGCGVNLMIMIIMINHMKISAS